MRDSVAADVVKGAIAGAAATWLMGQVTTWLYAREERGAKTREDNARGGMTAYERAAEKAASTVGATLSTDVRSRSGSALHWAIGTAAGVGYALVRRRWQAAASGRGLSFGAAFFLGVDELMNPLLGFTPGPRAFPWQAHARGLAGHLTFGSASELILEALDRVA